MLAATKGDTRSLDYSSHSMLSRFFPAGLKVSDLCVARFVLTA